MQILSGKNCWCLGIALILLLTVVSGKELKINYPESVNPETNFSVGIDESIYEAKIEIFGEGERIARIFDNQWKSTNFYVKSEENEFTLKIVKNYTGRAEIIVKLRDAKGKVQEFKGYSIEVSEEPLESLNVIEPDLKTIEIPEIKVRETIKLNGAKDIKSSGNQVLYRSRTEYVREYGVYFFIGFCILIAIVYILRNKFKNPSDF